MPQTGKNATAKSSSADSGAIVIGEIGGGSGGTTFDGEKLVLLYDALLGNDYTYTGTMKKVEKDLKKNGKIFTGGSPTIKALNAADFRTRTGGKNIYVTFGNIEFEATYLTFDNSGNVILTLWQSTSSTTSSFSAGSGYSADSACANGVTSNVPSNFYSASYIRNVTLGAGNTYNKYDTANATAPSGTGTGSLTPADTRWAQFTTGNYASYIVEPTNVHYQAVENYCAIDTSWFTLPEEAYGTPVGEKYFKKYRHPNGASSTTPQSGYYYFDSGYGGGGTNPKSRNGEWQNDKIWLPSYTEVFSGGIWKLDANQRCNGGTSTNSSLASTVTDASWSYLRNGHADTAKFCYCLNANGAYGAAESSAKAAVRPALHLNLTKASQHISTAEGAKNTAVNTPTDIEFTYDGIEYTDMASIIARVEAGKQASPADAKGDTNVNKEIKWFDEVLHAVSGDSAGSAANTIYETGSAIEYKIEYKQVGKSSYALPMTDFKIKGAGEYKITCSFETDSGKPYKWRDITTGALDSAATKTFTIKVNQLEVKYKWKSSGGKLNEANADASKRWKVTFDKDTFTPTSGNSQAPWVYLDYTLLKDNGVKDNANAALLTYDQTSKKSILGKELDGVTDKYDDTLPCIVVKYTNTESYDNVLDNIYVNKNGSTTPTNGTLRAFPQEAGNYTVNATDINAATSNYKLVPDTGEVGLTTSTSSPTRSYEIEQQEVNVPVKPSTILEYSGSEQSYCVSNYDEDLMEYGTWNSATSTFTKDGMPKDSSGNDLGMTAGTTGSDAPLTLKATKVSDYYVSFRLLEATVENTTAYPDPVARNYKWKSADTAINGTAEVVTINYAIEPKTLEFDFHSSVTNSSGSETFTIKTNNTDGKLTYSFKANRDPVIPDGETDPEEPVLELFFKVADSTGTGSKNPKHSTAPDEFLYADLVDGSGKHTAGKYIIYVALASSSSNPINKNYRLRDIDAITAEMTAAGESASDIEAAVKAAKATYEKEITLTAGEVSLNDLPIVYKEGDTITNSDAPTELSFDFANKSNLQYKLGSDGKTPVVYWIYFDLSDDFSFLETVGAISYQYAAPATDTTPCTYDPYAAMTGNSSGSYPMRYAGTLTITVKVQVKASERTNNKLPAQTDYDNLATATDPNKFTYTAGTPDSTTGNVYDGTLVFTYEIRKAEVDSTKIADTTLLQWKYSTDDDSKWKDYTATSFPQYNEIAQVDFRVNPSKYNTNGNGTLSGVKGASLDSITNAAGQPEKQGPGTRYVTIAYTVDENNYEKVNYNNTTLVGKYKYTVEISPNVIDSSNVIITTWKDMDGVTDKTNSLGVPYQIWELNLPDPAFANFIDYEYYLYDPAMNTVGALIGTGDTALSDLTNPSGPYAYLNIDAGSAAYIYVKPVINLAKVDKVNGEPKYVLKDLSGNTDKDIDGNDGYKKFEFGKQMTVIKVELLKDGSTYGDTFTAADIIKITMGGSVAPESTYNTKVYKDKVDDANLIGDLASFCTNSATLDAGKYIIKITAVNEELFVAVPATVNFEILPKSIELPTLDVIVFNGAGQNLANFLGGSWNPAEMTLGGDYEDIRDVSSNVYSATITLNNSNYCWAYPEATPSPAVKVLTKYSAADYEINAVNATVAEYKWNITPLVVDTTNMWSKGSKGATLNLPQNIKDLIAGGTLEVGYRYYDGEGNFVETPEIKGGKSFKVEAVFAGDDSVRNVQFKRSDATLGSTSPAINYTVPQSGAAAFFGNALSFLKSHWLWFLIALAVLLFLIILIIIIAKRRKNKEAREEKKAKKQEEKERREEEKRRREQELELEKAKREAELAKMKAELGLGAGAAGMAMAAQQAMPTQPVQQQAQPQQPVQQMPQYQPQYQQMPDNSVLARIEAELADIRAQQRMNNGYPQMPMMPMQGYGPQMGGGHSDTSMMALMQAQLAQMRADHKTELAEMRAGQSAAMKTEFEILKLKLDGKDGGITRNSNGELTRTEKSGDNEALGAVLASMVRNLAGEIPAKPAKAELPQSVEESAATSVDTPTVYPPDAVITTTTTVDTTKSKPEAPRSDDGRVFDLDGFYDTFENK